MPSQEHGDVSEAFQLLSNRDSLVKLDLNSKRARPSGVRATAMSVRRMRMSRNHLEKLCLFRTIVCIQVDCCKCLENRQQECRVYFCEQENGMN